MKKRAMKLFFLALIFGFVFLPHGITADTDEGFRNWEAEFIDGLERARAAMDLEEAMQEEGDVDTSLTPSGNQLLYEAVHTAYEQGGPECQIVKMAVERDFNPYFVLVYIYSQGDLTVDDLCMCSTEQGISTAVIARAARDAILPDGTSVFTPDEVAQSVCLQQGLPYTPTASPIPPPPEPPPLPPQSSSTP